jgi:hypothetical protein
MQRVSQICSDLRRLKAAAFVLDPYCRVYFLEKPVSLVRPIKLDELRVVIDQVLTCLHNADGAV